MKIDKAIMAWDGDERFRGLWEVVAPMWLKWDVTPVLAVIGDAEVDACGGEVLRFPVTPGIGTDVQAAWMRFVACTFFPDAIVITSDLDMMPLSRYYFLDQLKDLPDDAYAHLNPCRPDQYGFRYPVCYHVAKGSAYLSRLFDGKLPADVFSVLGFRTWFAEEHYVQEKLKDHKVVELWRDGGVNGHRICRTLNWSSFDKNWTWYDAHCPRPFQEWEASIREMVRLQT